MTALDRYTILESIGQGGMGRVYKAKDHTLDRVVAIKMLDASCITDELIVRFQREAKATSNLRHPGIVSTYDFGFSDSGQPYMVMEFAEGETLKTTISRNHGLSILDSIDILVQLCDAIAHAHERGVVHRDLKPGNILASRKAGSYQIRVFDFGVSKMLTDNRDEQYLTQAGQVVGSPYYLSPEQAKGSFVDARTDVYAMGCILFECLTGRVPFSGESIVKTIELHMFGQVPSLSEQGEFPLELETIVERALEKEPNDRYSSVLEMKKELLAVHVVDDIPVIVSASPDEIISNQNSSSKPANSSVVLLIGLVSILIVGASVWRIFYSEESSKLPEGQPEAPRKVPQINSVSVLPLNKKATEAELFSYTHPEEKLKKLSQVEFEQLLADPSGHMKIPDRQVTKEQMQKIMTTRKLTSIVLFGCGLNDQTFSDISKQKELVSLMLKGEKVTDKFINSLRGLKKLQDIDLEGCRRITATGLGIIVKTHPKIRSLNLGDTSIKGSELTVLKGLKELQSLDLIRMQQLSDADLAAVLPSLKNLKSLSLRYNNKLTDETLTLLESLAPRLEVIDLSKAETFSARKIIQLKKKMRKKKVIYDPAADNLDLLREGGESYFKEYN